MAQELKENLYVDDWLSGADSIEEGKEKFSEACFILAQAGMILAKRTSNSKNMMEYFSNKTCLDEKEAVKVLGIHWKLTTVSRLLDLT